MSATVAPTSEHSTPAVESGTVAGPTPVRKLSGFDFFHKTLAGGKHVVAPMVDGSELPWRLLSRRHGADVCYTPMMHARLFGTDPKYRDREFSTCAEDRPLVVQFCANDPTQLLKAAQLVQGQCDAVDINLGCPQNIAKKGHYGAFLQDEWDLIESMVTILHKNLDVPVTCKVRIFDDDGKTLEYAKMLERAGCQLLTVHGRTREQRGQYTGLANWDIIKKVREAVNIPVLANGNIIQFSDVEACMKATGVQGVMSAEGNLYNPAIFSPTVYTAMDMVEEYLSICAEHRPKTACMRMHLFKLFRRVFNVHTDIRETMAKTNTFEGLQEVARLVRERMDPIVASAGASTSKDDKYWMAVALTRTILERPPKTGKRKLKGEKTSTEPAPKKAKESPETPRAAMESAQGTCQAPQ